MYLHRLLFDAQCLSNSTIAQPVLYGNYQLLLPFGQLQRKGSLNWGIWVDELTQLCTQSICFQQLGDVQIGSSIMTFLDLFLVPGLAHHNDLATRKCGPDFMDTRVAQRIRQGQIKQDKIRDSVLQHQAGKASNTVYALHLEMAMKLV